MNQQEEMDLKQRFKMVKSPGSSYRLEATTE